MPRTINKVVRAALACNDVPFLLHEANINTMYVPSLEM